MCFPDSHRAVFTSYPLLMPMCADVFTYAPGTARLIHHENGASRFSEHRSNNVADQEQGDAGDVEWRFHRKADCRGRQSVESAPGKVPVFSQVCYVHVLK